MLATRRYTELHQLTIVQKNAIDVLLFGETDTEVAAELGIHRVTVTKWRRYHPGFQAELNTRRVAIWQSAQDRLRTLLLDALDALIAELQSPAHARVTTALKVLELGGIRSVNLCLIGPGDPQAIVDEAVESKKQQERSILFGGPEWEREAVVDELLRLANEAA
ncbi:MAG: hypothetical protein ACLQBX_08200 [Candidatus Limnocylindrales bacterium]